MDDCFWEKGIQKEENKHTQSYSGQSAGVAGGLANSQGIPPP